jgi:hypothetical protein
MKQAYIAVLIAAQKDMVAYAKDAVRVLREIAGNEVAMGDAAQGTVVCAFVTDLDHATIRKRLDSLWRPEQHLWVFAAEDVVQGRGATMDWVRRRVAASR